MQMIKLLQLTEIGEAENLESPQVNSFCEFFIPLMDRKLVLTVEE